MDFLKVSDKTTTPCRSYSVFGLNQQQYKDSSFGFEIHSHPHVISPYAGNGVLGYYYYFPFTSAQLKELERQAMIYKYMIASVPVPFDLFVSPSSASPCSNRNMAGELEPGRCRRTDGKKWRCSKEVVNNHKYYERHLHRGRPRSRKLVEPPYFRPTNNGGSNKNRDLPQKPSLTSINDNKLEPRKDSSSLSNYRESRIENRGSETIPVSSTTNQDNKYLNFIDIWSDGVRSSEKQSKTSTLVFSSNGNHSLYSLDLSMGGNSLMGLGIIGSGREDPHEYGPYGVSSLEEMSSWLAPISATPGGPLAEILRPNPNLALSGDVESYSLVATPSSSP